MSTKQTASILGASAAVAVQVSGWTADRARIRGRAVPLLALAEPAVDQASTHVANFPGEPNRTTHPYESCQS